MRANHLRPIASLISKSEKALQKLSAGTWQHTTLRGNLHALRVAYSLLVEETDSPARFTEDELTDVLRALVSMIDRVEKAQAKFSTGTPHHTLQRNRLAALRTAEARTKSVLKKGKNRAQEK